MPQRGALRLANACSISLAYFTSITWRRKPIGGIYTEGIMFSWNNRICNSLRPIAVLFATLRVIVQCVFYAPGFAHNQDQDPLWK